MTTKTSGSGSLPVLLLLTSVELLVFLEVSIVNVALPALGAALTLGPAGLAWVVNAYQLTFGGFQLIAGRVVDVLGRRRMFRTGVALFTGASLLAGLAPDAGTLLTARALQGIAAAVVVPAELALLTALFTDPAAHRRAFAVWSSMAAAGAGAGVALGGVLTQAVGWPWIFLINVPIGVAALIAAPRILPADPVVDRASVLPRLNVTGALTGTGCLLAAVLLAAELPGRGMDAITATAGVAAVLLGAAFAADQRRHRAPILPPQLLALPGMRAGAVANALVGASHVPAFVLVSMLLQEGMGYSAMAAGFAVLPIAAINMTVARTALPHAVRRFGHRAVLAAGMALVAAGTAGLALGLHPGASYASAVLPASILFAAGLPAVFVSATAPALTAAPGEHTGSASGVLNTAQRLGAALGLTALTLLATHWTARHGGPADPRALSDGLRLGLAGAAALAAVGVIAALIMLPRARAGAAGASPDRRTTAPATGRQHTSAGPAAGTETTGGETR
ncbi:MFS transporter [Streptomyces roseicoloratus]|uniref:MFS transporter n=1 Tax=Streptomyces roseicoloratus TaxID=2508722 RepID=A0ABY9RNR0_9ACTN|nr:MFS transporter [Streptomyces roseicoloratus]WMX43826.1 MFS transporter [Streptomyces roseicoloratus]